MRDSLTFVLSGSGTTWAPPSAARWPLWLFRGCVSVAALLVFNQAVFAGQFLAGSYGSLLIHRHNATYSGIAVLICAVPGVLLWRVARGPWWPASACVALFGLIAAQIALGFARLVALHIPLGVAIILGTTLVAAWAWRADLTPALSPLDDTKAEQ